MSEEARLVHMMVEAGFSTDLIKLLQSFTYEQTMAMLLSPSLTDRQVQILYRARFYENYPFGPKVLKDEEETARRAVRPDALE